jgi:small subunit ribosomal protein S9
LTETPEDEPRNDEEELATPADEHADQAPAADEPAAQAPAADEPAAQAPAADEPAAPAPAADEPAAQEPAAETEQPAPEEPVAQTGAAPQAGTEADAEPQTDAAPAPDAAPQPDAAPEAQAAPAPDAGAQEDEEVELAPRQKPEIPGADLIPDIVPEGDQYLDAEAQAAAEAEAEAAAARAREESEDEQSQPIADAAIDLAAGARYTATGKRKTAVARVILKPGTGTYSINDKPLEHFFPRETLQRMIRQPLEAVGYDSRMDVVARMHGGGVSAQAGALRHGVSRALIVADPNLRGELKRRGFLTRDPRVKERKKAGLKKARKRPQFSKR